MEARGLKEVEVEDEEDVVEDVVEAEGGKGVAEEVDSKSMD
jgi:hypothetical protein